MGPDNVHLDDKGPDHVQNTFRYSIGELKFGIFLHFLFTYFPHDSLQHFHYLLEVHSQGVISSWINPPQGYAI